MSVSEARSPIQASVSCSVTASVLATLIEMKPPMPAYLIVDCVSASLFESRWTFPAPTEASESMNARVTDRVVTGTRAPVLFAPGAKIVGGSSTVSSPMSALVEKTETLARAPPVNPRVVATARTCGESAVSVSALPARASEAWWPTNASVTRLTLASESVTDSEIEDAVPICTVALARARVSRAVTSTVLANRFVRGPM